MRTRAFRLERRRGSHWGGNIGWGPGFAGAGRVGAVAAVGSAAQIAAHRAGYSAFLLGDAVGDGVDQRQVGESLGVVAEVTARGGLELLGIQAEGRGVGEQSLAQVLGFAVLADLRQRRDEPE